MYIVTREPNLGQFHISVVGKNGEYHLVCAGDQRSFMKGWIEKLKEGKHPDFMWCDNHNKAFVKYRASKRYRGNHEFIGKTDTPDRALGLIEIMMMLDDEERKEWDS